MGARCCKEKAPYDEDLPPDNFPLSYPTSATDPPARSVEERLKTSIKSRVGSKVSDAYKVGKTLGRGGFSVVKLCTERSSGTQYACKIMDLVASGVQVGDGENTREDVFKEIEILCNLGHPNVLYMKEFFVEETKVYLITELLTGGEVLDAVLERGSYSEADARVCFKQLLDGISYLHSKNIVHRDLKLENLMLASQADITTIKIVDFGLANLNLRGEPMETICGTPQYVAPEVIEAQGGIPYNHSVDMWSAGVILFILLGGYPPFYDESEPAMFQLIRKGSFSFDDDVWDPVSESAKDLIRKLLRVQPERRITAAEALLHPWVTGDVSSTPLAATHQNLKKTYQRKFRKAVNVIVTINKMKRLAQANPNSEESSTNANGG